MGFPAKHFGVPCSTLQGRCKRGGDFAVAAEQSLGRYRPVSSPAVEIELVIHIKRMESILFGVALTQLKHVVYGCADANPS